MLYSQFLPQYNCRLKLNFSTHSYCLPPTFSLTSCSPFISFFSLFIICVKAWQHKSCSLPRSVSLLQCTTVHDKSFINSSPPLSQLLHVHPNSSPSHSSLSLSAHPNLQIQPNQEVVITQKPSLLIKFHTFALIKTPILPQYLKLLCFHPLLFLFFPTFCCENLTKLKHVHNGS